MHLPRFYEVLKYEAIGSDFGTSFRFYLFRYNGIFAAMNDCLYRSTMVGGYKYVINTDLDEFIVPRKHLNFHDMMAFLDPPTKEVEYASFMLRNMFFYLMHEDSAVPQVPSGKTLDKFFYRF